MLDVPQQKHFPVLGIERLHRTLQRIPQFLSLERFRRDFPPVGEVFGAIVAFLIRIRLVP